MIIVSIHTTFNMHQFADYKKMTHDCTCINQTHVHLSTSCMFLNLFPWGIILFSIEGVLHLALDLEHPQHWWKVWPELGRVLQSLLLLRRTDCRLRYDINSVLMWMWHRVVLSIITLGNHKLGVNTCSWRKTLENKCEWVQIGFGFTSD